MFLISIGPRGHLAGSLLHLVLSAVVMAPRNDHFKRIVPLLVLFNSG